MAIDFQGKINKNTVHIVLWKLDTGAVRGPWKLEMGAVRSRRGGRRSRTPAATVLRA